MSIHSTKTLSLHPREIPLLSSQRAGETHKECRAVQIQTATDPTKPNPSRLRQARQRRSPWYRTLSSLLHIYTCSRDSKGMIGCGEFLLRLVDGWWMEGWRSLLCTVLWCLLFLFQHKRSTSCPFLYTPLEHGCPFWVTGSDWGEKNWAGDRMSKLAFCWNYFFDDVFIRRGQLHSWCLSDLNLRLQRSAS